MKFDFRDSRYVRMFEDSIEGRRTIQFILNDPELLRSNYTFWKTFFPADLATIPAPMSGFAAVRAEAKMPEHATMADWRAPLGNSRLGEEGQAVGYNAGIIDLITLGWQEQAMEREYREKIFQDFGSDAPLLLGYATDVLQPRIDSINMALSNMAAQALSTGEVIYKYGKATKGPVYKAPVPKENFTNFSKAISDPTIDLLAEMAALEEEYKENKWGLPNMSTEWCVPYDMFMNVFLKNQSVIDYIKTEWLIGNGQLISQISSVPNSVVTADAFNKYVIGSYPGLSPIRVIEEKQFDDGRQVNGWKPNTLVLKPTGNAGKTYRTEILDRILKEKYGNSLISKVWGTTADGVITVSNTTGVNGEYKYWATDVYASATPILETYLNLVIVDGSQAKQ